MYNDNETVEVGRKINSKNLEEKKIVIHYLRIFFIINKLSN